MKLVVASPTGLCFGVRRAIEQLEKALATYGTVYALGSPIHNPQEVARLKSLGLEVIMNVNEVSGDAVVFVRAHGISRAELEELKIKSRVMVDGTCPFVRNAQKRAESLASEGYKVIILGDSEHPEVRGILGYIEGDSCVIGGKKDVDNSARYGKIGILSQTTQNEASLADVVAKFVFLTDEIKVYNTICRATIERQESIKNLAGQVDGIIVIGGRNSANTRKLVEISESLGVPTMWVEHAGEVDWGWTRGRGTIGVAAGGSTPDWLINDLTGKLKRL
ncbi:MAG: 4-hydroxy-3-methylbut-2-enyl diphosphate reductase [Synergistaceae bacterium]|jgi:4-hydroxy-3-methylbut-2-enyl diphosphate reductase|nr:4-hydroxy-3-methylbut-2-enyl diphosphate reductase [Synergistaceae bacterium]